MNNFPRFEAWCAERDLSWPTKAALLARLVARYGAENIEALDPSVYYAEARSVAFRIVFGAVPANPRES